MATKAKVRYKRLPKLDNGYTPQQYNQQPYYFLQNLQSRTKDPNNYDGNGDFDNGESDERWAKMSALNKTFQQGQNIEQTANNATKGIKGAVSGGGKAGMYNAAAVVGGQIFDMAGDAIMKHAYNSTGVNNNQYIAGSALKEGGEWGAKGASLGTAIMPGIGTAIGAGVGFVGGAIAGGIKGSKKAKEIDAQKAAQDKAEAEEKARIAQQQAEQAQREKDLKDQQQKAYDTAYAASNPTLQGTNSNLYAMGGEINPRFNRIKLNKAKQLASDIQEVKGKDHEDGGEIAYADTNKNLPIAEVENGEVIKDNKVYSDRIGINGKTYAEIAKGLAKEQGKAEKQLQSTSYRERNSASRRLKFVEKKLEFLNQQQNNDKETGNKEYVKEPYNGNDTQQIMVGADGLSTSDWANLASSASSVIDNIYNIKNIKDQEKVEIPKPTQRVYYAQKAMPLKTTYDVSSEVAANNSALKDFQKNVDNTTSNSQVARGNKLAAFASYLNNNNSIYQNKENIETQLANQSILNSQGVYNANQLGSAANINTNAGLTDEYNQGNYAKALNILRQKSANMANLSSDLTNTFNEWAKQSGDYDKVSIDELDDDTQAKIRARRKVKNRK